MIGRCYCHSGWCYCHCQLFQFKFWDFQQNFIPYVWQMELAHIPVKGWIISPDVNGFFYCSEEVLIFPCQYTEIFYRYSMTRGGIMVMYWWRRLLMFFVSLPKCSSWLTNIFFITLYFVAHESVYDPTSLQYWKLLEEDTSLHQRTSMAVKHINWLLEFCLTNTYFSFQGKLYEQKDGAAMGSPISPIAANIFMEDFENRALATSPCTPKIWKRFVDDAFTIIKKNQKQTFLEHLNSINNNIQFTSEDPGEDGSIPFLDMLIIPDGEGRLKTTVYRKPTHTNQYLHWDSHHDIPSKYSKIGILFHRAKTICSEPKQLQEEEEHLYKSLKRCKYPTWALNRVKMRSQTTLHKKKKNSRNTNVNQEQKTHITVPYHQGLSESF